MAKSTEMPQTVQWNGEKVPVYPMETIDYCRILSHEPEEIERLLRCCQTEGFFYLDLRGIDGRRMLDDQESTLQLMHRFFEAPLDSKNEFGLITGHLGYVVKVVFVLNFTNIPP